MKKNKTLLEHQKILEKIYEDDMNLYNEIKEINDLLETNNQKEKNKILIEFLGSARSGKSTAIEKISEVFRKYGVTVEVIDEEYVKITKKINKTPDEKKEINSLDYTNKVIEEKIDIFDNSIKLDSDIIIFDRGINDEFNWLKTFGEDNLNFYNEKLEKRKVDLLIIETCDEMTSLKRKYRNSLSLVPTKWTNLEICNTYLKSIETSREYFDQHSNKIFEIDTSNINTIDASILIIKEIINILYK